MKKITMSIDSIESPIKCAICRKYKVDMSKFNPNYIAPVCEDCENKYLKDLQK